MEIIQKKQLSSDEKNRIINLHSRDYKIHDIAIMYEIANNTVYRILNRHKKKGNVDRLIRSGPKANKLKLDNIKKNNL